MKLEMQIKHWTDATPGELDAVEGGLAPAMAFAAGGLAFAVGFALGIYLASKFV